MIINLEHDEGQENVFEIDDCYYSPSFNARIMCPQQWAQQRFDKYNDTVAHCDTTRQNLILEWSHAGQVSRKTIPLTRSNVGFTSTNIGCKGFFTFLNLFQAAEVVAVSDDEEETNSPATSNMEQEEMAKAKLN